MLNDDVLIQFEPFKTLDRQILAELAKNVHFASANKGTIIFKRGKILTDLYFLLEGQVNLINNEFGVEKVSSGDTRAADALNTESPTRVSAIAKSPVKYMTVPSELLKQLSSLQSLPSSTEAAVAEFEDQSESTQRDVEIVESGSEKDWMSCLLQAPIFTRIPLNQLQDLFRKFESVEFEEGDVVVKEGAQGDYFYVIASGSAHITNKCGSVDLDLRPGQYFGEESLVSKAPRNASVVMTSKGIVKRLCAEDFVALLQEPVLRYVKREELDKAEKPYKLLDVKMPIEYRFQHEPGSINVPLSRLRKSLNELASSNTYAVAGDAGSRADIAAYLLCQAGFDAVVLKTETAEAEQPTASVQQVAAETKADSASA